MATPRVSTRLYKKRPYGRGSGLARIATLAARNRATKANKGVTPDDASTVSPASPSASSARTDRDSTSPVRDAKARESAPEASTATVENGDVIEAEAEIETPAKPLRQPVFLPSVFEGRPPVIFFSYTEACAAKQRDMSRAVYPDIDGPRLFYSHSKKVNEFNAVINCMRQGGLYRVKEETERWALLWSKHPPPETLSVMRPVQRTNHFPGSQNLGQKDLLWDNIARMQRRFGSAYSITPVGYVLPRASAAFEAARQHEPDALWIWKPCTGSCGRGIEVFSSRSLLQGSTRFMRKPGIVQRYVPKPLTIDGYKFDMRVYVVVVSYDPLRVHINHEGLVRLATHKYSEDPETLSDRTMHLTNYSVNKHSPLFVQNMDGRGDVDQEEGSSFKWSLTDLKNNFQKRGLDYDFMLSGIKDAVIKTLLAVEPSMRREWAAAVGDEKAGWFARGASGAHSSSCFEQYGFDILVDDALKAWVLEVNICPSLSSGSPLDKRIKTKLVADTLTLVGVRPPPSTRKSSCGLKRPYSEVADNDSNDFEEAIGVAGCAEIDAKKAAKLAACENPQDAIALFDQQAWELVLEAHDQDMRCGGLERIYPTDKSAEYVQYMSEESYANVVLRKWYEAGGGEQFWGPEATQTLPSYLPRRICSIKT